MLKAVENVGVKHLRGSNEWKEHINKELFNFRKLRILKALTDSKSYVSSLHIYWLSHVSKLIQRQMFYRNNWGLKHGLKNSCDYSLSCRALTK